MSARPRRPSLPLPALLLPALLSLGGCVTFESAPAEALGCDPALLGRWLPEKDPAETRPGTVDTTENGACALTAPEKDGSLKTQVFRTFERDGARYIVVEEDSARRVVDDDGRLVEVWPQTRVALYRYRVDGDRVRVWMADFDVATQLQAPGVSIRTNVPGTGPAPDPAQGGLPATEVYLSGSREALAALLRDQGERLYSGLAVEQASTLRRVDAGDAP